MPGRKATTSPLRRASQCILAAGSVLAVAAAFGPIWVIRAGVALAVIAGVVACLYAWKEFAQARAEQSKKLLEVSQAQTLALTKERTHNASVIDTLVDRAKVVSAELDQHRTAIATLRSELSSLHGDNAFLKGEITSREATIAALRETVRAREAELSALQADPDAESGDAEVHQYPRRVLSDQVSEWDALPSTDELWTDGDHPTVIDLRTLDFGLPNYEGRAAAEGQRKSS